MLQVPGALGQSADVPYGLQVWLVAVAVAVAAAVKGIVWFRQSLQPGNPGGGSASDRLRSEHEGEWRATIKLLISNQLELSKTLHQELVATRTMLANNQAVLQELTKAFRDHDQREVRIWDRVVQHLDKMNGVHEEGK